MELIDHEQKLQLLEQENRWLQEQLAQSEANYLQLQEIQKRQEKLLNQLQDELAISQEQFQAKSQELETVLNKLKATQEKIIAQEKLASLGALTAGIAHEIKNPLNFVNNFAELSVELTTEIVEEISNHQDKFTPEELEYLEEVLDDLAQNVQKIHYHGQRADNIVKGMLMHSRGQAGERRITNINTLLNEYVTLAYHGMRAKDSAFNITIQENYDPNLPAIHVVPQNLSRVFLNLVNNACYAAYEKQKQLATQAGNSPPPTSEFVPILTVSTQDLGKQIEIKIRDNGTGIPPDLVEKVFNPFFTTKPTGEGTGLGLSISHDIIVQEHQGEIKINTQLGEYTEFIITLPKHK